LPAFATGLEMLYDILVEPDADRLFRSLQLRSSGDGLADALGEFRKSKPLCPFTSNWEAFRST
jgi:hypothetical protein